MKSLQQLEESKTTLLSVPAEFLSRLPSARWAPIPLRLIVGYGFMEHGFAKLARGPDSFSAILYAIGVPAPDSMAWATILVEIFGGLAILLGAVVVLASIPMAAISIGRDVYGASALRIQFDQAAGGHRCRRAVWAARI